MTDYTGKQCGNYHLLRLLESGRSADVYLGKHQETDTPATVKLFHARLSQAEHDLFFSKANALARLEHTHILRIFDYDITALGALLAQEYIPNVTLRQYFPQGRPLPLDTIVSYIAQIGEGSQYAHDHSIVHGDLRPENVLLGRQDEALLDNFTIEIIQQHTPVEHPLYPAQEALSPASDQYALAALAYEWLNGTSPAHLSADEIRERQRAWPPSLRDQSAEASGMRPETRKAMSEQMAAEFPTYAHPLYKALDPDPTQRYESIREFVEHFTLYSRISMGKADAAARTEVRSIGGFIFKREEARQEVPAGSLRNPFGAGSTFSTHPANAVSLSPDGKRVAFGGWDNTVVVCEVIEGGNSFTYTNHTGHIREITWSPDGRYIASATFAMQDNDVQVWEATTGEHVATLPGYTLPLAWSADGRSLVVSSAGTNSRISIWHPFSGEIFFTYEESLGTRAAAWSPAGERLALVMGNGYVQVWTVPREASSHNVSLLTTYRGHYGSVNALAWSPDGQYIASGGDDATVQVWNAATREGLYIYRYQDEHVTNVGWSPDGRRVRSSAQDRSLREWDAFSGEHVASFTAHMRPKEEWSGGRVVWTPTVSHIASGFSVRRVHVVDMRAGKLFVCRAPAPTVEVIGHAPESLTETTQHDTRVLSGGSSRRTQSSKGVQIWGQDTSKRVRYTGHSGAVSSLAWSPDSRRIASAGYDTAIRVWDATTRALIYTYREQRDPIVAVAWSPDGRAIAAGSLDATVTIWDVVKGVLLFTYRGHSDELTALAWSPDSQYIASASKDRAVHVWQATSGATRLVYRESTSAVLTVAWSPAGHFIACGSEKQVHVWDAATGQHAFTYRGHTGEITALAWSPDGRRIASGSDWMHRVDEQGKGFFDDTPTLHVWDATSGEHVALCAYDIHRTRINSVTWSPAGTLLATTDVFRRVLVYDGESGEAVAVIHDRQEGRNRQTGQLLCVAWSPDGTRIAASSSSGEVSIWPEW